MEFVYNRLEHCILLDNLKNEVVRKTLAYMVDYKEHDNLVVIPKPYSIEISNADICIAIIIFSGFEKEEYETIKTQNNHHVVSFDSIIKTMIEFDNIHIKHIDYMALFFTSLTRTDDVTLKEFLHLRNLSSNKSICHLRNKFLLKGVVWNYDLFHLLYKKSEGNVNFHKTKKQYLASMVLESYPSALNEDNLRSINSRLIKNFFENNELLNKKTIKIELVEKKPLFVGFSVVSGNKRAKKAIKLVLSSRLINEQIIKKTKTILLHISSDSVNINMDEIAIISDNIQERVGNNATIVVSVSEDKNLGKSLSVALFLSEFEVPEIRV